MYYVGFSIKAAQEKLACIIEYGLQRTNSQRYFKELIEKGFIEKYESNKHRKKVNVYRFSSKWKDSS